MHCISEKWRDILLFNDLESYEKVWNLEAEWFEEPNQGRGGWSGVSRIELKLPLGGKVGVFLKRQENHVRKSLLNPIRGKVTFEIEFNNIKKFFDAGIPTLETIFFESRNEKGKLRAVLMTEELTGFNELSSEDFQPSGRLVNTDAKKKALFTALTGLMHKMHQHKFMHNCFYLKHVFGKPIENGGFELRVIDLEKAKKVSTTKQAMYRDLYTLLRHAGGWSDNDKMEFFKMYQGEEVLGSGSRKLWQKLNSKIEEKSR